MGRAHGERQVAEGDTTYTQAELDAKIAEANKALERKRDELLQEAKAAKDQARTVSEQYQQATARMQELEQKVAAQSAGVGDEKLKELTEKMRADFERTYQPFKSKVGELEAALAERDGVIRSLKLDTKVKDVMAKSGVRSERVEDLFRLTSERYDLTDDGEVILKENREVPLDKFFKEDLSEKYPEFYTGSGSSGGGASRSDAGGGGSGRVIAADDGGAFMANLEGVAAGKVTVRQ